MTTGCLQGRHWSRLGVSIIRVASCIFTSALTSQFVWLPCLGYRTLRQSTWVALSRCIPFFNGNLFNGVSFFIGELAVGEARLMRMLDDNMVVDGSVVGGSGCRWFSDDEWMKLGGNRPPGDNPLLFSISGTGSVGAEWMGAWCMKSKTTVQLCNASGVCQEPG